MGVSWVLYIYIYVEWVYNGIHVVSKHAQTWPKKKQLLDERPHISLVL